MRTKNDPTPSIKKSWTRYGVMKTPPQEVIEEIGLEKTVLRQVYNQSNYSLDHEEPYEDRDLSWYQAVQEDTLKNTFPDYALEVDDAIDHLLDEAYLEDYPSYRLPTDAHDFGEVQVSEEASGAEIWLDLHPRIKEQLEPLRGYTGEIGGRNRKIRRQMRDVYNVVLEHADSDDIPVNESDIIGEIQSEEHFRSAITQLQKAEVLQSEMREVTYSGLQKQLRDTIKRIPGADRLPYLAKEEYERVFWPGDDDLINDLAHWAL